MNHSHLEDYLNSDFPLFAADPSNPQLYSPGYDMSMDGQDAYFSGVALAAAHHNPYPAAAYTGFEGCYSQQQQMPIFEHQTSSINNINNMNNKHSSPHLLPAGSPELRAPPSNRSTASGPSATSSAMNSPYSGHSHVVPAMGLAILGSCNTTPGIVAYDSYGAQDYSFPTAAGMEHGDFAAFAELKPGYVDPSLIHGYPAVPNAMDFQQPSVYPPPSPALSQQSAYSSHPSHHPKQESSSPYYTTSNQHSHQRRPSLVSRHSQSSYDGSYSSEAPEKGRCPNPECGKTFKDLKAHMLTHMNERPEKCPIQTCDYHVKGFARKYDKNRHTLTHYKGTMVCGFCPGSGSAAEKSFNRADVFKRHLTSVHGVEQTPPNSRKKSGSSSASRGLAGYAPDATGKCSTCSATFTNAQDFYEHLDDCVLRIVQQEEPSEAINANRLAEVENDEDVHATLRNNNLPTTTIKHPYSAADDDEDDEDMEDAEDDDYHSSSRTKAARGAAKRSSPNGKRQGLTHSKGGVTLHTKAGRKNRKNYPSSWGCPGPQMKMKKRVMVAFDGPKRLFKDDMMLSTEFEVRIPLADGRSYVTDLDVQTLRRAEAFHGATDEEKGPDFWAPANDAGSDVDLDELMAVKQEQF